MNEMKALVEKIDMMVAEWQKTVQDKTGQLALYDGALQAAALIKKEAEGLMAPVSVSEPEPPANVGPMT